MFPKKYFSVIVAVLIGLFLTAPAPAAAVSLNPVYSAISNSNNTQLYPSTSSYCYEHLTANGQILYNQLLAVCKEADRADSVTVRAAYCPEGMTLEQAREVYRLFQYDHPEFFYLDTLFYKPQDSNAPLYIRPALLKDFQNQTDLLAAKEAVRQGLDTLISEVLAESAATDYDRCMKVYEKLRTLTTNGKTSLYQSMASVFLGEHQVLCAGMTKAFSYVCNSVGVNVTAILGAGHAWNLCELDGTWYHIDVLNGITPTGYPYLQVWDRSHEKYVVDSVTYATHSIEQLSFGTYYPLAQGYYDGRKAEIPVAYLYAKANCTVQYYLSADTASVQTSDLITRLWLEYNTDTTPDAQTRCKVELTSADIMPESGWRTPAQIYEHRTGSAAYYYGMIPCKVLDTGSSISIGPVWIGLAGDCDLNGVTNAADAAAVLQYAAALGAGETLPRLSKQADTPEEFSVFLAKQADDQLLRASDAAMILQIAAANGAGIE